MALKLLGIAFIAGFVMLAGLFAYFRKDLPNLRDISGNNIGGSIRYYDRTGQVLLFEDYDAVKRIPVGEDGINQYMKDATVAIEDKDFYKHGGLCEWTTRVPTRMAPEISLKSNPVCHRLSVPILN